MNRFLLIFNIFCLTSIHADVINITVNTQQCIYQINQTVNRPIFSAFINIINGISNETIDQIDVSSNTTRVNYSNNMIVFNLPILRIGDEFYVTFDEGVLYSNSITNSSAQFNHTFLSFKVVDFQTSTTFEYTSMGTTQYVSTGNLMNLNNTSAFTATILMTTEMKNSLTTGISTTDGNMMKTGEPPPTRSAQLGMGLGISFIAILLIIEIIYFKYCYTGDGRSQNYYP